MSDLSVNKPGALYDRAHDVFRGTYFQAVLLGLISFTQPGIWTAMNSLGAGGQAEPYVVNAANVITFVVMFFFSPLASMVGNIIGMKWIILFGTLGYVPYSAALYCNTVWGTQWFLIFGAVTCGFSLGINKDDAQTGAVAPKTYLVLVALQCLGLPLALLLAPPNKLIRKDGKKPTFAITDRTFKTQFWAFVAQFKRKEVVLLIPAFITAQWGVTYQGNYLAAYFTVRARTLAAFVIAVIGAFTNVLAGWWLDTKHVRRSTQARGMWYFLLVLFTIVWIWNIVIQERWARDSPGEIDWNSRNYGQGLTIFILYRIAYETIGIWLYWVMGTFDVEADTIALSMGVLRSGESLGSVLAYAVGSVRSASLMTNLIVSVVVFYVGVPATSWAAHLIKDRVPNEDGLDTEGESSEVE
ncbi:hypothetical protein QQX98_012415 [Neonectria punicea]|uniref:UNC93-like protein n=1 Tax=Neonectria punicea TaxID=979145 RepID=A0ABR1GIZ2_9HYPO